MKVLVCIKRVLDYQFKLYVDALEVRNEGDKFIMSLFDEIAVEEAVRLKEAGLASSVVVVSVGQKEAEAQLRYALSMGCDEAFLITGLKTGHPRSVAKALSRFAQQIAPSIILMGKQAIDTDSSQVPQRLAAELNWDFAGFASKISVADGAVEVEKEVDYGIEVVRVQIPCVISVDLRLNSPRLPPLPAVLKAKSKPLNEIDAHSLNVEDDADYTLVSRELFKQQRLQKEVKSVDELVSELRARALI